MSYQLAVQHLAYRVVAANKECWKGMIEDEAETGEMPSDYGTDAETAEAILRGIYADVAKEVAWQQACPPTREK